MAIFGPLNPAQLASAGRNAVVAAARRLRPDHRSIAAGSVEFPGTSMLRFYVYAAVAPSRSAARAFDDGQVRRAAAFAQDAFSGVFTDTPESADRNVTVFAVSDEGAHERALYVHRTGLVELLWALAADQPADAANDLLLDTREIAAVVLHLARAAARRPYSQLSRAGRGRRRFARVDWWFNLTADVSTADGSLAWTGFQFPGPRPRRARNRQPSVSPSGYGGKPLRNRSRRKSPDELARVVLGDLVAANGYYEFASIIDRVVEAAAGTQLPAPSRLVGTMPTAPTDQQRRVLNAVFEQFRSHGRCPEFRELDKQLDLEGLRLRELAESMPPGLLLPVVSGRGGFFREDDELMVSRDGLRFCENRCAALDLLARVLAYLAKCERPFVPKAAQRELKVTSDEMGHALRLTTTELQQVRLMLEEYEWQARTTTQCEKHGPWSMTVACEYVRRFRGVRDGEQYLRARDGESFAHQLDAEEALPRFTLIGDTPSIELDGQPIVLRVENNGPSETFQASVIEITNAQHAPAPWHVRWRGETAHSKEILSGAHWVLEIARDDSLRGIRENKLTPGFIFLQPNDQEVFVAQTGPSVVGARYGLPLRARVRVTPRSQPKRGLETVVTLQITEHGRQVLWNPRRAASDS